MARFLDARIRLVFGAAEAAGPDGAMLREGMGGDAPPLAWFAPSGVGHAGCGCCAPRNAAARALSALFLARARGECRVFNRVIATPCTAEGRAEIAWALAHDPLVSGWFRLDDQGAAEG